MRNFFSGISSKKLQSQTYPNSEHLKNITFQMRFLCLLKWEHWLNKITILTSMFIHQGTIKLNTGHSKRPCAVLSHSLPADVAVIWTQGVLSAASEPQGLHTLLTARWVLLNKNKNETNLDLNAQQECSCERWEIQIRETWALKKTFGQVCKVFPSKWELP